MKSLPKTLAQISTETHIANAEAALIEIKRKLAAFKIEAATGKNVKNWGFSGSAAEVAKRLEEIAAFI